MSAPVLVVDDNSMLREVIRAMLEARGIAVVVARDGEEALKAFASEHIAAALVDMDMPGPNGVEVCRALRHAAGEKGVRLPIWLMTGVQRPGLEARAKAAGALGVLAKPFTTGELLDRVDEMLVA